MAVTESTLVTDNTALTWPSADARKIKVDYHVKTDSVMGPLAVIDGAALSSPDAIPSYGDSYALFNEVDAGLFLLDFTVTRATVKDEFVWKVGTTYRRRESTDPKPGEFGTKPVNRTTEYWVLFRGKGIIMESADLVTDLAATPVTIDAGTPVKSFVNTVGDEYDEPPTDIEYNVIAVARHYFATYAEIIDFGRTFAGRINAAAVTLGGKLYAARTLKMIDLQTGPAESDEDGDEYFEAITLFANDPDEFKFSIVNRGFRWWDAVQSKKRTDDPDTHEEINYPRLIELQGTLTPINVLGKDIEYRENRTADYDNLPFD